MTSVSVRRFGEDMLDSEVLQRLGDGEHRIEKRRRYDSDLLLWQCSDEWMSHQRTLRTLLTPIDHVQVCRAGITFTRAELNFR